MTGLKLYKLRHNGRFILLFYIWLYVPWLRSIGRSAVFMNVMLEDMRKNTRLSITTPIQGDS
jgi:hypothetical protein